MLSATICLLVASSWAMGYAPHDPPEEYDPHDPSEKPIPINPLEQFWGSPFLGRIPIQLPISSGVHGYAPSDDNEHSDRMTIPPHIPGSPPKPPKMDNSKQGAQVINNYYIFAKEIKTSFDAKIGALPWSPPAKPEGLIPHGLPKLPPIKEKVEQERSDFLKGFIQGLKPLIWKIPKPDKGPETIQTALPVIEDKVESSMEAQPSVNKTSETETDKEEPPQVLKVAEPEEPEEKSEVV